MTNKILYIAKNALIVEVLAVTALLLSSCTRTTEPEGIGGNSFVNFGVTVEGAANATKGTMLNSGSSLSKISATAWNNDTEHAPFISGYQNFTLTEGSATTDIRWTRPYEKIFYAYANLPASGAGVTSDTYEGQTLTYTAVPADAANQNDILMGTYAGDGTSTRTASLAFKHPLTSVVFKVGTLANVKKITAIRIAGVYASGSVTQGSDGSFGSWTASGSQTVTQTITADLPTTAGTAIGVPFILIPQTAADGLEVEMELTLTDDSTMTCTGTLGKTTGGIIWEAGKTNSYTISADVANNLIITSTVSEWGLGEVASIEPEEPAPMVLTLSFKSVPGGLNPQFIAGETVRVSNGSKFEDCAITVSDDTATITTTLSEDGDLTAVYPASAAKMNGNSIEGVIVPETQDGGLSNASISLAQIAEGEAAAQFELQAAVFVVTPPAGTTQFTVKSLKQIVSGHRTGSIADINTGGSDATSRQSITIGDGASALASPCYVALCAGANLSDLAFDTGDQMKGLTPAEITENAIAPGNAYTIDGSNWHAYVTLGGTKWATMNIGASNSTQKGWFLAWGATEVAYSSISGTSISFKSSRPASYRGSGWNASSGFYIVNTPFSTGSSYNEYTNIKSVLELTDDAAYVNWGGPWRMPSEAEYTTLLTKNPTQETSGYTFTENSVSLFFPFAGVGVNTTIFSPSNTGGYWTNSVYASNTKCAVYLDLYSNSRSIGHSNARYYGQLVRAVAE